MLIDMNRTIVSNQTQNSAAVEIPRSSRSLSKKRVGNLIFGLKSKKAIVLAGVVLVVIFAAALGLRQGIGKSKASVAGVLSQTTLNRNYSIPVSKTNSADQLKVTVTQARLMNSVKLQGQDIKAETGKVFLLVDLELQNTSNNELKFMARDYFRLIVDSKPFAPQFYNSNVTIAPVAVVQDRVAFVVDKSLRNFKLQVGDVKNPNDLLTLSL